MNTPDLPEFDYPYLNPLPGSAAYNTYTDHLLPVRFTITTPDPHTAIFLNSLLNSYTPHSFADPTLTHFESGTITTVNRNYLITTFAPHHQLYAQHLEAEQQQQQQQQQQCSYPGTSMSPQRDDTIHMSSTHGNAKPLQSDHDGHDHTNNSDNNNSNNTNLIYSLTHTTDLDMFLTNIERERPPVPNCTNFEGWGNIDYFYKLHYPTIATHLTNLSTLLHTTQSAAQHRLETSHAGNGAFLRAVIEKELLLEEKAEKLHNVDTKCQEYQQQKAIEQGKIDELLSNAYQRDCYGGEHHVKYYPQHTVMWMHREQQQQQQQQSQLFPNHINNSDITHNTSHNIHPNLYNTTKTTKYPTFDVESALILTPLEYTPTECLLTKYNNNILSPALPTTAVLYHNALAWAKPAITCGYAQHLIHLDEMRRQQIHFIAKQQQQSTNNTIQTTQVQNDLEQNAAVFTTDYLFVEYNILTLPQADLGPALVDLAAECVQRIEESCSNDLVVEEDGGEEEDDGVQQRQKRQQQSNNQNNKNNFPSPPPQCPFALDISPLDEHSVHLVFGDINNDMHWFNGKNSAPSITSQLDRYTRLLTFIQDAIAEYGAQQLLDVMGSSVVHQSSILTTTTTATTTKKAQKHNNQGGKEEQEDARQDEYKYENNQEQQQQEQEDADERQRHQQQEYYKKKKEIKNRYQLALNLKHYMSSLHKHLVVVVYNSNYDPQKFDANFDCYAKRCDRHDKRNDYPRMPRSARKEQFLFKIATFQERCIVIEQRVKLITALLEQIRNVLGVVTALYIIPIEGMKGAWNPHGLILPQTHLINSFNDNINLVMNYFDGGDEEEKDDDDDNDDNDCHDDDDCHGDDQDEEQQHQDEHHHHHQQQQEDDNKQQKKSKKLKKNNNKNKNKNKNKRNNGYHPNEVCAQHLYSIIRKHLVMYYLSWKCAKHGVAVIDEEGEDGSDERGCRHDNEEDAWVRKNK